MVGLHSQGVYTVARAKAKDIDEYIGWFSPNVQEILQKIRAIVRKEAPEATERISYGIPALAQDGDLIYFAAFKNHIGLFPPVRGDEKLRKQVAPYSGPKGNLRFSLDEPMPYALIGRVVKARLKEHQARLEEKKRGKKARR
jgi:uncharacterized protein YdhG (YjbR/CyaY superfamily)